MIASRVRRYRLGALLVATACLAPSVTRLSAQQEGASPVAVRDVSEREVRRDTTFSRQVTVRLDRERLRGAIEAIATSAGVTLQYRAADVDAVTKLVTLHVEKVALGDALARVLAGTDLRTSSPLADVVTIKRDASVRSVVAGIVSGTVRDAHTKLAIAGAMVLVDNAKKGVRTGADGSYRVTGLTAGPHVVLIKLIGYARQSHTVTIEDGANATLDVALVPSTRQLDQVVVTGTVVATELKSVSNAITVITAKELEERGITHIDQLFRGDVPGLWVQNQGSQGTHPGQVRMTSRGSTTMDTRIALGNTPIKTYLDGIELADPSYLGLIDPRSIERIEIIPGPQASSIYGSNAINGVMQVFTKRGSTPKPQLTFTLSSGLLQNNFSTAMTPQHDYSGGLSGADPHVSYNIGGSWTYLGPWTPSVHQTTASAYGGVHLQANRLSIDASLRRTLGRNWANGDGARGEIVKAAEGEYRGDLNVGRNRRSIFSSGAQSVSMVTTYTPVSWWSQTATVGSDVSDAEQLNQDPTYNSPRDTNRSLNHSRNTRTSLVYTTTVRASLSSVAQATVTAGADGWHDLVEGVNRRGTSVSGRANTFSGGSIDVDRTSSHARGAFLQGKLGIMDALFFDYGLRVDWNKNYGADANPNIVPRYAVAYTTDIGSLTAKARASFGHGTLIPAPGQATGRSLCEGDHVNCAAFQRGFGQNVYVTLPNPDLVPEQQQGWEGGLDLYFGNRASLEITRFNQTVDNQIMNVDPADSILSILPRGQFTDLFPPEQAGELLWWYASQNVNAGSVRNQGWSLNGMWNAGPLTFTGTYSWTKSRVIGITPRWQVLIQQGSFFAGQFVKGAAFQDVPEHTMAGGVRFARGSTTIALNLQGQGKVLAGAPNLQGIGIINARLQSNNAIAKLDDIQGRAFFTPRLGYAIADLNASQRFSARVEGFVQFSNLANAYYVDRIDGEPVIGRQSRAGVRINL